MGACLGTNGKIVSYSHKPTFDSIDPFYDISLSDGEHILLYDSLYHLLLNFPLQLETYTSLYYSSYYCLDSDHLDESITLSDFSLHDVGIMSINAGILISPIIILFFLTYGLYLFLKSRGNK